MGRAGAEPVGGLLYKRGDKQSSPVTPSGDRDRGVSWGGPSSVGALGEGRQRGAQVLGCSEAAGGRRVEPGSAVGAELTRPVAAAPGWRWLCCVRGLLGTEGWVQWRSRLCVSWIRDSVWAGAPE